MNSINPDPWVTLLMSKSVKLFEITYGRLPGLGLDIKLTKSAIPFVPPHKPTRLSKIVLFAIHLLAFLFATVFFKQLVISQDPLSSFNVVELGVLFFHLSWSLILSFVRRNATQIEASTVISLNTIMGSHKQHRQGIYKPVPVKEDICGIIFVGFVFGMIACIPFLPLVLWYIRLDPFTTVITSLFGSNISSFKLSRFVALLLTYLMVLIELHDMSVILFVAVCSFLAIQNHLETLSKLVKSFNRNEVVIIKYYEHLTLLFNACADFLNQRNMALVISTQVSLVMSLWLAVNCYKFLPFLIVFTSVYGFFAGLGIALCLLRIFTFARIQSAELINEVLCMGSTKYCGYGMKARKSQQQMILQRKWWAQQELQIKCGQRFAFSKDAILNYLNILNSNLTNAVLLLQV